MVAGLDEAFPVGLQREILRGCLPVDGDIAAGEFGDDFQMFPCCVVGNGGEKAADDEFVDLPLVVGEIAPPWEFAGRMDRRMVGRLLIALGRGDIVGRQQALGIVAEGGVVGERSKQFARVEILGIDRVVSSRVGEITSGVQFLGNAHRLLGGVVQRASGANELRGIKRCGRAVGSGSAVDRVDRGGLGVGQCLVDGLCAVTVPEAFCLVAILVAVEILARKAAAVVGFEIGKQLPVVLGIEGLDLAFAVNDQLERRALDATDRDEIVTELAGRK